MREAGHDAPAQLSEPDVGGLDGESESVAGVIEQVKEELPLAGLGGLSPSPVETTSLTPAPCRGCARC